MSERKVKRVYWILQQKDREEVDRYFTNKYPHFWGPRKEAFQFRLGQVHDMVFGRTTSVRVTVYEKAKEWVATQTGGPRVLYAIPGGYFREGFTPECVFSRKATAEEVARYRNEDGNAYLVVPYDPRFHK